MSKKSKKAIRAAFRASVFKRDDYTCQVCGYRWSKECVDPNLKIMNAHHITDRKLMPNGGYVAENGITVCDGGAGLDTTADSCHMRCEQWHISGHTEVDEGLHPDDLYLKIGSSHGQAVTASERL